MSKTSVSRRHFLTAMGVGTAAAAAAVATQKTAEKKPAPAADKKKGKGYQVTEHVQNYYRTTRV